MSRQLGYACAEIYVVTDIAAARDLGPELVFANKHFVHLKLDPTHLHYPGWEICKKAKSRHTTYVAGLKRTQKDIAQRGNLNTMGSNNDRRLK